MKVLRQMIKGKVTKVTKGIKGIKRFKGSTKKRYRKFFG